MARRFLQQLLLLALLVPGLLRGVEGWARLKLGMTADAAARALGDPLIKTNGQGFEVWIYDHRAEVLFYGPLIGWTTPPDAESAGRVVDVWQAASQGIDAPVYFLPRPALTRARSSPREPASAGANKLPLYRLHR